MKILVTGSKGQLGSDVVELLDAKGIENKGISRNDCDITDRNALKEIFADFKPSCVIHCGAYTNVEKAETERNLCYTTNVTATKQIAKLCKDYDSEMVYISTDYVFGNNGTSPHSVNDKKNPLNYYGYTKLLGEEAVLKTLYKSYIVRTSWLFGGNGNNFVKTMLRLSATKQSIDVVCDQIGSPTYSVDLADFIVKLIESHKYGIYHATNEGFCSFAVFAKKIMEFSGRRTKINFIFSNDYKSNACRPLNSILSKSSLASNGFSLLPHWENALEKFLSNID